MRPVPLHRRPGRRVLAGLLSGALGLGLAVGLGSAPAPAAPEPGARSAAQQTLDRARSLLSPGSAGRGDAWSPAPGSASAAARIVGRGTDATLLLRELQQQRSALTGAERRQADDLLARPATAVLAANEVAVVHGTLGPGLTAAYAEQVLATATRVYRTYVGAGYRAPLPDGALGGDPRLDVYLTDLAPTGAYGYCTSDQPPTRGTGASWAFCVLDDSYLGYPGGDPAELLQVTTAHELFHAVQYAYDSGEDGWFLEGTAAWAEDLVYPGVDDNLQYLPFSPLAGPRSPLDLFDPEGFRQYGAWVFFRWLSERFPATEGGLPVVVRQLLEAADNTGGPGDDRYSTQAIKLVLKRYGLRFEKAFALFADANRRPRATYAEARANDYPAAPLAQRITLSASRRTALGRLVRLDHLTSATTRFVPRGLGGRARLRVRVDLAVRRTSPTAVVSTYRRGGGVRTRVVRLDARGDAVLTVRFGSSEVRAVEVTAANASTRFADCYQAGVSYSCFGTPVHDDQPARLRATVLP